MSRLAHPSATVLPCKFLGEHHLFPELGRQMFQMLLIQQRHGHTDLHGYGPYSSYSIRSVSQSPEGTLPLILHELFSVPSDLKSPFCFPASLSHSVQLTIR